ncbi:hypothetical protein [Agriterribacter sp.]|uniref:hypothetical protein n=1 Tax=Agriterribacter sp. TaxID=2821509 RepID=UPI002CD897E9|nr:hypothetical protein [Agriterribacter sp.]HRP56583.1 hypothetical protein [Agriterribacter sp.]
MKEYLLLRNNTELGHYSLEELRAMGLKAYDLVWVENKSCSWKYPSEISELAAFAPPVEMMPNNMNSFGSRIVNINTSISGADRLFGSDEDIVSDEPPVRHIGHIVAFKPRVDHTRIRTIKSTVQPHVVKVELRQEKVNAKLPLNEAAAGHIQEYSRRKYITAGFMQQAFMARHTSRLSQLISSLSNNNKMEMVVLMIGAASLLAVAWLFITTGY